MKAYPSFTATITDGKIKIESRKLFDKFLSQNFKPEQRVTVTVKPIQKRRSDSMNNFYWLYLRIIADETGEPSAENLHELFKKKFLMPRFMTVLGELVELPPTTTTLTSLEFDKYIEKIEVLTEIPTPIPEWEK